MISFYDLESEVYSESIVIVKDEFILSLSGCYVHPHKHNISCAISSANNLLHTLWDKIYDFSKRMQYVL